jgi:hypothetical protein
MPPRTSPGLLIVTLIAVAVMGAPAVTGPAAADTEINTDYEQVVDITFPLSRDTPVRYGNDYHSPRTATRMHQATDLMVAPRTPVYAAYSGTVGWMSTDPARYGWMFNVRGDDGRTYVYIHLGFDDESRDTAYAPHIERGARVERGELIGWAGCSGSATCGGGEHLHFEIHDDNVIDPYDYHNHERINPYWSLLAAEERGDYGGPQTRFRDVPSSATHFTNIERLAETGITRGCNPPANDRFCPDAPVTRAQMATFLQRTEQTLPTLTLTASRLVDFDDTVGNVHANNIAWLAATGVTRGCNPPSNTRFCPDDPVTRAQMATFLVRALGLPAAEATFTDTSGNVHEANIAALAAAGITRGCNPPTNDRYCPDAPVTRAQMATFLMRAMDLMS